MRNKKVCMNGECDHIEELHGNFKIGKLTDSDDLFV